MPEFTIRERQRLVREEAILDGAEELMETHGYQSMTMDDLAAALNVSKATLYQHFRSKEDLAVSVLTRIIRRGLAHVRSLDPAMPPLRRIEAIIAFVVQRRYAEGHPDLSGHVQTLLPVLLQNRGFQEVFDEIIARLTALLEQGKREGDVDPHFSTPVLVQAFLGLIRNTDYGPLIDTGQCSVEDVRQTLTTLVLRGLGPGMDDGQRTVDGRGAATVEGSDSGS